MHPIHKHMSSRMKARKADERYDAKMAYDKNLSGKARLHYLDDIVIFSKDLASHLKGLEAVFQKLEEAGLKLKPSKCELFQRQLAYLGHVISAKGVATDESKIEAIKNWPTPTNVTEV